MMGLTGVDESLRIVVIVAFPNSVALLLSQISTQIKVSRLCTQLQPKLALPMRGPSLILIVWVTFTTLKFLRWVLGPHVRLDSESRQLGNIFSSRGKRMDATGRRGCPL